MNNTTGNSTTVDWEGQMLAINLPVAVYLCLMVIGWTVFWHTASKSDTFLHTFLARFLSVEFDWVETDVKAFYPPPDVARHIPLVLCGLMSKLSMERISIVTQGWLLSGAAFVMAIPWDRNVESGIGWLPTAMTGALAPIDLYLPEVSFWYVFWVTAFCLPSTNTTSTGTCSG